MAAVPYDDDEIRRFVVHHYAFDPARNERRNMVVAVVDNVVEFEATCQRLREELQRRRASGDADPREHLTGLVMEPGHLARAAEGHLLRRAVEHGVWPKHPASDDLSS